MIIDPQTLVALEMDRHLAAAQAARAARASVPRRGPRGRRGLLLRLVAVATGRTATA